MKDPRDQLWQALANQARLSSSPAPVEPDPQWIEHLLTRRAEQRLQPTPRAWNVSLATGVAWVALAASLLVAVWNWTLLEAAWSPRPEPWQIVTLIEP